MIKKVEVLLSFPLGARFTDNLDVSVYRQFINFIHQLSCFNSLSKCKDCRNKNECRYYSITGNNLTQYPGILVKSDLFSKTLFKSNEQKIFTFYFVGNNEVFSEYVSLYFTNLNQRLFGNFFYLKEISNIQLNSEERTLQSFSLYSPVESINFSKVYNEMGTFYNRNYGTDYKLIGDDIHLIQTRQIEWVPVSFRTKKISVDGFVGKINIPIPLNTDFLEIGIGKYNFIGGGQIEN